MEEAERVKQEIDEALNLLKEAVDDVERRSRLLKAGSTLQMAREASACIANNLPSHTQLQLQQRLTNLQNEIEARNQQITPTKKFSFRNRDSLSSSKSSFAASPAKTTDISGATLNEHDTSLSFLDRTGENITVSLSDGAQHPVLLSHLINCKVCSYPFNSFVL